MSTRARVGTRHRSDVGAIPPPPRRIVHQTLPESLPAAAASVDHPHFANSQTLVTMLRGQPPVLRQLHEHVERRYRWGPARRSGDWALLYLCYVNSRFVDVQPWYQRIGADAPEWALCGFTERPSYITVYLRFRELEESPEIFRQAAGTLIQKARGRDCRVGAWQHVDGTEADTHSAPVHDCKDQDECPTRREWERRGAGRRAAAAAPDAVAEGPANDSADAVDEHITTPANDGTDDHWHRRGAPVLSKSRRLSADDAAAMRRKLAEKPADDAGLTITLDGLTSVPAGELGVDDETGSLRFTAGGHWWRSRDTTAGLRAYTHNHRVTKYWMGYICITVVDHFTWAPLAIHMIPANTQEYDAYDVALAQSADNLGGALPKIMGGDRGYSVEKVFKRNSELGIASAIPYRRNANQPAGAPKALPTDPYDEHGIPRCPGCAGGTDWVRFAVDQGRPTVWVRCVLPGPTCPRGDFRVRCATNWRRILPIWRTHAAYLAVRRSHQTYESAHRALRSQFGVAPNELALRPKRKGIACQQLRAFGAMVIAWLRTLELLGLGTSPRSLLAAGAPDPDLLVQRIRGLRARQSWRGGGVARGAPPGALPQ